MANDPVSQDTILELTGHIVAAYVAHNATASDSLSALIKSMYTTLIGLSRESQASSEDPKPAVPIKRSVTPDYIICLEDGRRLKMLKRHLRSRYKMSPTDYRAKWGLSADYPMVAPNYSERRSAFAKKIGLGRGKGSFKRLRAA
jgi:predicted transcriptional regulator